MREIIKPAINLFLICLVVAAALAVANLVTKDRIVERAAQDAQKARSEVLGAADSFEQIADIDITAGTSNSPTVKFKEGYRGMSGANAAGYVFLMASKGYAGDIVITVGIDSSGTISGVKIGDNKETPGLGSKASDKAFISQLAGMVPKEPLKVVKGGKSKAEEIDAISGATITSVAVVKAVQAAVDMATWLSAEGGNGQ